MPRQSLNKSIAARKLNPRTKTALSDPEVTIPFGAIIDSVVEDGEVVTFQYLSEPYRCPRDIFQSAVTGGARLAAASTSAPEATKEASPELPALQFEALSSSVAGLSRAKVAGGWLIVTVQGGVTFYPDAWHTWKGESL